MNLPYAPDAFADSVLNADDIDFPFDDWTADDHEPLPDFIPHRSFAASADDHAE